MRIFFLIGLLCWGTIVESEAESFIQSPKKSVPKFSPEECCEQILEGGKKFARITQYIGAVQAIDLSWAEDFLADQKDGVFSRIQKDQSRLREYMTKKEKYNAARQEYEKILKEELEFLKEFENTVKCSSKKK